jgi:DNA-binding CsgD family transcriptional regulator
MSGTFSRADLRSALDALGALSESATSTRGFAVEGVARLRRLVPSDLTTLSICDLATNHRAVVSDAPSPLSRTQIEAFDRHFHEHPLVRAHGRNRAATTHRMSDLVPLARLRRTPLFNEYYRPLGIAHVVAVPVHVRGSELVSFVLNRAGRDFSERDRDCLELMRPHLGGLFRLSRELESARGAWGVPAPASGDGAGVTPRERDVMRWLAAGKTDRDIADILGISRRTVHKHLQRIYEKLGVETRTAAAVRWLRLPAACREDKP